jgi:hypothetical protein
VEEERGRKKYEEKEEADGEEEGAKPLRGWQSKLQTTTASTERQWNVILRKPEQNFMERGVKPSSRLLTK